MQDINSKRFLRIKKGKDRKVLPYKRNCSLTKLANLFYNNFKPPFEKYDKEFTKRYLKDEGGQKVWKL